MNTKLIGAFFLVVVSGIVWNGHAQPDMDKKVQALIERCIIYFAKHGKVKTIAEINNPKGMFVDDDLYMFASDLFGVTIAHGANSKYVGMNQNNLVDPTGKQFYKEFVTIARSKEGKGWVEYTWSNPQTQKIQFKRTHIKLIPTTEIFLGCGYYK